MDSKHKAMLDYLKKYPGLDAFLRFNSIADSAGNISVQTVNSNSWEKRYVGGHGIRRYDFAIVSTAPQDSGTSYTNVEQMQLAQDFMDWIEEQGKARNFPDFEGCRVLSIENLQNMPDLAGVNASGNTAKYMFQVYILDAEYSGIIFRIILHSRIDS